MPNDILCGGHSKEALRKHVMVAEEMTLVVS